MHQLTDLLGPGLGQRSLIREQLHVGLAPPALRKVAREGVVVGLARLRIDARRLAPVRDRLEHGRQLRLQMPGVRGILHQRDDDGACLALRYEGAALEDGAGHAQVLPGERQVSVPPLPELRADVQAGSRIDQLRGQVAAREIAPHFIAGAVLQLIRQAAAERAAERPRPKPLVSGRLFRSRPIAVVEAEEERADRLLKR